MPDFLHPQHPDDDYTYGPALAEETARVIQAHLDAIKAAILPWMRFQGDADGVVEAAKLVAVDHLEDFAEAWSIFLSDAVKAQEDFMEGDIAELMSHAEERLKHASVIYLPRKTHDAE